MARILAAPPSARRACRGSAARAACRPTHAHTRCRGVPCLREHLGQRVGVVGEVLERHRAVLDEADRLAVALEAHHDVEAGLAHLPQVLLRRVVGHLDHAARQAEVAHQLDQLARAAAAAPACRRRRTRPAGSPPACRSAPSRWSAGRPGWRAPGRSSCGRPARPRSGPSLTMCCAASIAARKVGKLTTPSTLARGSSARASASGSACRRACLRRRPAGARG